MLKMMGLGAGGTLLAGLTVRCGPVETDAPTNTPLPPIAAQPIPILLSSIVALVVVLSNVYTSALAGYIFAKYHFPLKNTLFMMALGTMMVPFIITVIPAYYIVAVWLRLKDTLWAMILPRWQQTNLVVAASMLVMAPLIIVYFIFQRAFVQGIVLTGMKYEKTTCKNLWRNLNEDPQQLESYFNWCWKCIFRAANHPRSFA